MDGHKPRLKPKKNLGLIRFQAVETPVLVQDRRDPPPPKKKKRPKVKILDWIDTDIESTFFKQWLGLQKKDKTNKQLFWDTLRILHHCWWAVRGSHVEQMER